MSTITELAADVARAQRAHDELLAEQRDLPTRLARAGRGDTPEEWTNLAVRQSRLPAEIADAATAVLRARLAERWADVESMAPDADQAHERLVAARAQHAAFEKDYPRHKRPIKFGADLAALHAQAAVVQEVLDTARIAHRDAEHAVLVALHDIGQLEDQVEIASGIRPNTEGPGLRAPTRTLAQTHICTAPGSNDAQAFLAGTTPPRWVAWKLRRNDKAFSDSAPHDVSRPAQDPNSMIGETQQWGALQEADQPASPQNIGQYLRSDSLFTHPEIDRGSDVFKPEPGPHFTIGRNSRARW